MNKTRNMRKTAPTLIVFFLLVFSAVVRGQTPVADFEVGGRLCVNDTVKFTNLSTNYTQVRWFFGDGRDTYRENPIHIYEEAGEYTVKLRAITDDGSGNPIMDVDSQTISINNPPEIRFDYSDDDLTIYQGQEITISLQDANFPEILWSTGSTGAFITVTEGGEYSVTVADANGCSDTAQTGEIVVKPPQGENENIIKVVNNIMTPNGDGFNEFLIIEDIDGYANPIEMSLYNVWGDLVYETPDYRNEQWKADGLDAGTYYYHLRSEGKQGVTGFIDVIK